MLRRVFLCAVVVGCVFASDLTRAAIINGDFETGDFSGWSVDLDADNGANDVPGTAQVATIDGSFRAVLTAATNVFADPGNEPYSNSLSEISQPFTLTEAATIAVDVSGNFEAVPAPFWPGGEAILQVFIADTNSNAIFYPLHIGSFNSGYHTIYSFGPLTVAKVVPAGDYMLVAHAIASNNGNLDPGGSVFAQLTVDNFRVLAVPEPSALALLVMAACALPLIRLCRARHVADSTQ